MNHDYPIDQTVALRLELHRVTDQRDAFQAALHKDVLSLAKAAVEEAVRSTDQYNGIIDTQLKVIDGLKAKVDALTTLVHRMDETINVSQAECRKLKAEVESLMTTPTSQLLRASRAENILLRKAGDDLAHYALYASDNGYDLRNSEVDDWQAAKDGIETA